MQQTETYKLNKPEAADPFTPTPLNENADKLEAALSALTAAVARHCLDRLAVGNSGENSDIELDLSGVDMAQYGALIATFSLENCTLGCGIHLNGKGSGTGGVIMVSASGTSSKNPIRGSGFAFLIPAGQKVYANSLHCAEFHTGGGLSNRYSGVMTVPWSEIRSIGTTSGGKNATLAVYGLRI